ncbi:MAG: DUF2314 domain-containing protein [Fimbriimonadales bacterium]
MRILVAFMVALTIAGCGSAKRPDFERNSDNPEIVSVDQENAELIVAIKKARQTLPQFIEALNNPKPDETAFLVKYPLKSSNGEVEHIWMHVDRFQNGKFYGRLAQAPVNPGAHEGDEVSVARDEIDDWAYVKGEETIGAFTDKVISQHAK